jgi:hypothetical protein
MDLYVSPSPGGKGRDEGEQFFAALSAVALVKEKRRHIKSVRRNLSCTHFERFTTFGMAETPISIYDPALVQSGPAVFMNALASLRRHPVYRDALICQLVAFVLTAGIDGLEHFLTFVLPAWILFWVGLVVFVRIRLSPTKPELFVMRFGPLFIFIVIFVIGQYL